MVGTMISYLQIISHLYWILIIIIRPMQPPHLLLLKKIKQKHVLIWRPYLMVWARLEKAISLCKIWAKSRKEDLKRAIVIKCFWFNQVWQKGKLFCYWSWHRDLEELGLYIMTLSPIFSGPILPLSQ